MIGYPTMYPPYMKSPEEYRNELMQQVNQQMDQYRHYYDAIHPSQPSQNIPLPNGGNYVVVHSKEEADKVQTPSDGKPIMVFDEKNGNLYSKKIENGNTIMRGFHLTPIEEKQGEPKGKDDEDALMVILAKLDDMNTRLDALEGKANGGNGTVASGKAEKAEP